MSFERPSKRLDAIAAATADAVSEKPTQRASVSSVPSLPFYTFRTPTGAIESAMNTWAPEQYVPLGAPRMHYLVHRHEVDACIPPALASLGTLCGTVGLDLEWDFGLYVGRTAVMQIATATDVFVIQLSRMSTVPTCLVEMLRNPRIRKVGVAIQQDLSKLQRDFGIQATGGLELSRVASELDPECWTKRRTLISLRDLCMTYLQHDLDKGPTRISTWTRVPLTETQLAYAASDAYVSLELFHAILLHAHKHRPLSCTQIHDVLEQAMRTRVRTSSPTTRKGPMAHERAWQAWVDGRDLETIARERQIQLSTAATYVAKALSDAGIPKEQRSELFQRLRCEFSAAPVLPVTL
ncbi:exodeoxyribonuclease I [Malassezia caprae]|uniref:Exodeoxyribonuclease I n=1 Tax=Malassezia caprae TaxID=1381934 RepID=A0AAF0J0Y0_9BASI|nr:exodeoxyribonuclease I [Malassezia caprae]